MWSDIVQIKVIKDESDMLYFKYSYRVTISDYKFKTTNKRHVEINRTAKRQKYKAKKGITSPKKTDILMLYKKGLIPKQYHAFFDSPTEKTPGQRKMILILTVILAVRKRIF